MKSHDSSSETDPEHTDRDNDDRTWFGGKRWTGFSAIAVVAVLIVCGVVAVVVTGRGDYVSGAPVAAPSVVAVTSVASATVADPGQVPTAPPGGVIWTPLYGIALPHSTADGPSNAAGDIVSGWSHTPKGALLASVNAYYRLLLSSTTNWKQAVATMAAPGPGVATWSALRDTYVGTPQETANDLAPIAGFEFLSYDQSTAKIGIVSGGGTLALQSSVLTVVWVAGDWKLQIDGSTGSTAAIGQNVTTLSGSPFVAWGPTA